MSTPVISKATRFILARIPGGIGQVVTHGGMTSRLVPEAVICQVSNNALVTAKLLPNGLGLQVQIAEDPGDDPAFHRCRNERDGDDEIAVNLSRRPVVLEVERDIRLTMKPTR